MEGPFVRDQVNDLLHALGVKLAAPGTNSLKAYTPITGELLAQLPQASPREIDATLAASLLAFGKWRSVPAPRRGELVRLLGEELRAHKQLLGKLVSIETGKILQEGLGEVQEMIDICDFAVGLSRQLYGLAIASERPQHRMMETWHPLGPCLVISAFNFPVAVWAWNAALALVCGDTVIWKPSEKASLSALATAAIFERALQRFGDAPDGLHALMIGARNVGEALVADSRLAIVSATGSTQMGRKVAEIAAKRFAKTLLELGGNNAAIVCESADLELVERAVTFAAVGTAGQRCTSLRRLIVCDKLHEPLISRLSAIYGRLKVGNPLEADTLVGPLIDKDAFHRMQRALELTRTAGGAYTGGTRACQELGPDAYYVRPALVVMPNQAEVVCQETFAPILYVLKYSGDIAEAIALNNAVPQGLSSSIFTNDVREMEIFLSSAGSDCGIANVNIGPSGAEIGGAFGGEKDTGGGRESGSDSWKAYMRRATNTINYGRELPLAQGIKFDIG